MRFSVRSRALTALLLPVFLLSLVLGQQPMPPLMPPPAPPGQTVQEPGPKADGIELAPVDPKVNAGEGFIEVAATVPMGGQVQWLVLGSAPVKYKQIGTSLIVSIPPAGNIVHVYAVGLNGTKLSAFVRTQITVLGQTPAPKPDAPVPVKAKSYNIVVVDDATSRAKYAYMAQIANSAALRNSLKAAGHLFIFMDISDPSVTDFKLDGWVKQAGGPPALLLQNRNGGVIDVAIPCPQTPNDLIAVVNKTVEGR